MTDGDWVLLAYPPPVTDCDWVLLAYPPPVTVIGHYLLIERLYERIEHPDECHFNKYRNIQKLIT